MREIVRILCGSHLYGTDIPGSDKDYKVVFIPEPEDILLGRVKNLCKKEGDDDVEYMSYQQYLKLLCQGQTNALDMLFAPPSFYQSAPKPEWYWILDQRQEFLSRNSSAFVGYCRQQASKYSVKLDRYEAVKSVVSLLTRYMEGNQEAQRLSEILGLNELVCDSEHMEWVYKKGHYKSRIQHFSCCQTLIPVSATVKLALETFSRKLGKYGERVKRVANLREEDWKSMYHAVRVAHEAIELMETGKLTFPRPERSLLKAVRLGKIPVDKVGAMIEENLSRVEEAVSRSELPERPDWRAADELVASVYRSAVLGNPPQGE